MNLITAINTLLMLFGAIKVEGDAEVKETGFRIQIYPYGGYYYSYPPCPYGYYYYGGRCYYGRPGFYYYGPYYYYRSPYYRHHGHHGHRRHGGHHGHRRHH